MVSLLVLQPTPCPRPSPSLSLAPHLHPPGSTARSPRSGTLPRHATRRHKMARGRGRAPRPPPLPPTSQPTPPQGYPALTKHTDARTSSPPAPRTPPHYYCQVAPRTLGIVGAPSEQTHPRHPSPLPPPPIASLFACAVPPPQSSRSSTPFLPCPHSQTVRVIPPDTACQGCLNLNIVAHQRFTNASP